ncbi:hypothetical protein JCM11251_007094 [Rhodosporidiobolus azoricus]
MEQESECQGHALIAGPNGSKHRLIGAERQVLAAEPASTDGVKDGRRKVKLELRTGSNKPPNTSTDPAAVEHRASAVSLAETLSPPPAYETAISLPLPSSSISHTPSNSPRRRCAHRHRSHRRNPSTSSTTSFLSDPTSDSEDPLNDLLRLTNPLLATSTSILASSSALQGSLARLLRSPSRENGGRSPTGARSTDTYGGGYNAGPFSAEDEPERAGVDGNSRKPSPTSAQSVEQSLRSELALSSFASDELDRLGRDVERYDVQRRGRDPGSFFLGGNREARAEKGRTAFVTATAAEGDELDGLGLGPSPASSRRKGVVGGRGGMTRSPSAAADLLGKLAGSSLPASGTSRGTSYTGGRGWSSFQPSPSSSSAPTPSSSKITLDAPSEANATGPGSQSNGRRAPLYPSASSSAIPPHATATSGPPATPLPTLPQADLSSRPTFRRSPPSQDLRGPVPQPLSPAASLAYPSPSPSKFSIPSPSSPVRITQTPTQRRLPSHRGTPSISLARGTAALPTSISFEDLDSSSVVASPSRVGGTDQGSKARQRLQALAGTGGEDAGEGKGGGGGSWWSWT